MNPSVHAMRRPSQRRKIAEKKKDAAKVVFTLKDRLLLVAAVLLVVATLAVMILFQVRANDAAHESRMRAKYQLTDEQLVRFTALEKQHREVYGALRDRAEKTRRQVEERLAGEKEATPETRQLFEQANAEREACWTEEIAHHRRVSQTISTEQARLYLAEKERRYQQRKKDRNSFLILPHK